jgi:hypothetical protein
MDAAGNKMYPFLSSQRKSIEEAGHAIRMMGKSAQPVLTSELRASDNRLNYN